jgi:uncharacterized protein YndB with AHSA1/START domain/dihydrofolate reductase
MTHPTTITAQPGTPFIDIERDFDATPAEVYRASTDPELVVQWLGPYGVEMELDEFDARPGGRYRYVHRDADGEYWFNGVFHSVTPDRQIIQTFEFEGAPGQVSLETMTLEALDADRTRLRTHSVFPSVEVRDEMVASGMEQGIRDSMDRLADTLRQPDPTPAGGGRVVVDITMSLDGYVTAPGADVEHGLGIGGEALHDWVFAGKSPDDAEILDRAFARTGAVIMGRNTFDVVDGPHGWNEEMGYGADRDQSATPPVFVVTSSVPDTVRLGDRFRFVTDGLAAAVAQAREAAGDKDVVIMGGGAACHSFLAAGLVDELSLHIAPLILGDGTRLFPAEPSPRLRLRPTASVSTEAAHHVTYDVLNAPDHA